MSSSNTSFPADLSQLADNMGIGVYQTFSIHEASLVLRCPIKKLQALCENYKIAHVRLSAEEFSFFGYQLLQYILDRVVTAAPQQNHHNETTQEDRILRAKEVQALTTLSRTTIWRLERTGDFPPRVTLLPGVVGWKLSDIQRWIASKTS